MAKPLKNKSPNHISPLTDFIKFKEEIIKFKKHYNKTFKPKLKKKVTKPKAKKMPEKLTLPANAQLRFNLLCNTNGSNKFYQIYVVVKSGYKVGAEEHYKYDVYIAHGRVGYTPVIGLYRTNIDDISTACSYANTLCNTKISKGYKAQSLITTTISTAKTVTKKLGRKSKLVKALEVEQQIKIDNQQAKSPQGTGRFSLINLD